MGDDLDSMRRQIALLRYKTPKFEKIASSQQVQAYTKLIQQADKLLRSGGLEATRSVLAELRALHGD